jgi:hypothetical protein
MKRFSSPEPPISDHLPPFSFRAILEALLEAILEAAPGTVFLRTDATEAGEGWKRTRRQEDQHENQVTGRGQRTPFPEI